MFAGVKQLVRIQGLPCDVLLNLHRHHITTTAEFLTRNPLELMALLSYSWPQLLQLTQLVSASVAPPAVTALSIYQNHKHKCFMSTSLRALDVLLHGGLPAGCVTEVSGPPGCGKTQFCIMLCIAAANQEEEEEEGGRKHSVLYIDTEAAFSAERLVEMARCRHPGMFSTAESISQLASNVHVYREMSCDSLTQRLGELDELVTEHHAGLVVVDSIASLLRKEYDTRTPRGLAERSTLLSSQAAQLKYVAGEFMIPIVVTNQITTRLPSKQSDWSADEDVVVTASLGNMWAHSVNSRMTMEFAGSRRRKLTVAKSPLCEGGSVMMTVGKEGLWVDSTSTGPTHHTEGDPLAVSLTVKSSSCW